MRVSPHLTILWGCRGGGRLVCNFRWLGSCSLWSRIWQVALELFVPPPGVAPQAQSFALLFCSHRIWMWGSECCRCGMWAIDISSLKGPPLSQPTCAAIHHVPFWFTGAWSGAPRLDVLDSKLRGAMFHFDSLWVSEPYFMVPGRGNVSFCSQGPCHREVYRSPRCPVGHPALCLGVRLCPSLFMTLLPPKACKEELRARRMVWPRHGWYRMSKPN